jgi:hypothetical protein
MNVTAAQGAVLRVQIVVLPVTMSPFFPPFFFTEAASSIGDADLSTAAGVVSAQTMSVRRGG